MRCVWPTPLIASPCVHSQAELRRNSGGPPPAHRQRSEALQTQGGHNGHTHKQTDTHTNRQTHTHIDTVCAVVHLVPCPIGPECPTGPVSEVIKMSVRQRGGCEWRKGL